FALVLGVFVLMIVAKDRNGITLGQRISVRISHLAARSAGSHLYRSGPLGRTKWGTCQLPGIAARLSLAEHRDTFSAPFAVIHSKAQRSYTVVLASEPAGGALRDQHEVDQLVANWGWWLAQLGEAQDVLCAAVTVETQPDPGIRLRRTIEPRLDPAAPEFARAVVSELLGQTGVSNRVDAYVSITFKDAGVSGKRRNPDEFGREIAARLPALMATLQETGAGPVRALDAAELCEVIRTAYDPASGVLFEEARAEGLAPPARWSDAGPAAAEAGWDGYRHDGAWSRTWTMTIAPTGTVQSSVLTRLLAPHRDVDRKRITLVYRPIDPGVAAAVVEHDKTAAQFGLTASRTAEARKQLAVVKAAKAADEEASGAGLVEFGMIVTATVTDPERKDMALAAMDTLPAMAKIRLRTAYGAQDSAFAAGLPLGVWLPSYQMLPAEVRDKL
ncbi:MAG: hypothetical protein LBS56_10720, partial [Propionibacteriaceae bacterium]|nr:hypothetical protein [Propionibacteriaceae bacterium]